MHGDVHLSGEEFSVGFVLRVVNETYIYISFSDDSTVYDNSSGHGDVVNGILDIDIMSFHWNLFTLYRNSFY